MEPLGERDVDELLDHAPCLDRLARRLAADESSADDLVQDTLVTALEAPRDVIGDLGRWMRGVVRHLARQERRREGQRRRRELDAHEPRENPTPAEQAERDGVLRHVADTVHAMRDPYREVVLLRYFEDMQPAQIAEHLGRPVETVKSQLKRALQQLREGLDREYGERSSWSLVLLAGAGHDARRSAAAGSAAAATTSAWFLNARVAVPLLVLLVGFGTWWALQSPGGAEAANGGTQPDLLVAAAADVREPAASEGAPESGGDERADAQSPESASASAADTAAEPAAAPPGRTLKVRTVDTNGTPVDAEVFVWSVGSMRSAGSTTGGELATEIEEEEVGQFGLVSREQYVTVLARREGRVFSELYSVVVPEGGSKSVTVAVPEAADVRVRGRILDDDGLVVEQAYVEVGVIGTAPRLVADGVLVTPTRLSLHAQGGEFELSGIAPGRMPISLSVPGKPGVYRAVEIPAVPQHEVDLIVPDGATFTGVVRDEHGQAVADCEVWYEDYGLGAKRVVTSGADGSYRLPEVRGGPTRIWALTEDDSEPDGESWRRMAVHEADVVPGEHTWDPVLTRTPGIRIRLVDEALDPLVGWRVICRNPASHEQWTRRVDSDEEGRVTLHDVLPGLAYRVRVYAPGPSKNVALTSVQAVADEQRRNVVISSDAQRFGTIEGDLLDAAGDPLPGDTTVALYSPTTDYTRGELHPDGRFRFDTVPPGDYELQVSRQANGLAIVEALTLAPDQALVLPGLRAPALARLQVDWRWPEGATDQFQFFHFYDTLGRRNVRFVDFGPEFHGNDFHVYPGVYRFDAKLGGQPVQMRVVELGAGAEHRLVTGPQDTYVLPVDVALPESASGPVSLIATSLADESTVSLDVDVPTGSTSRAFLELGAGRWSLTALAGERTAETTVELGGPRVLRPAELTFEEDRASER